MHSIQLRFAAVLPGLLLGLNIAHSEKLEPPSEVLHSPAVNTTATEFVEVAAFGHVVFRKIKHLSGQGETPELIDLIVPPQLIPDLEPGSRQLIAWTAVATDPLVPEGLRRDPAGARLVYSTGLEPALFKDTPENRKLLRWDAGESDKAQRRQLPRLLKLLDNPEPAVQDFAVAEIALRPALVSAIDVSARKRLVLYAGDSSAPDTARALLLELASQRSDALGTAGWDGVVEHVLENSPLATIAPASRGNLIVQAFALIKSQELLTAGEPVERWLRCDNAGIAELALLQLRRVTPDREPIALELALARNDLPADTRTFLLDHQRRLRLMTEASH